MRSDEIITAMNLRKLVQFVSEIFKAKLIIHTPLFCQLIFAQMALF